MIDFLDRTPTKLGRRKLAFEDGSVKYANVEIADEPLEVGTPLNRSVLMALQGFQSIDIEFRSDGTVIETNEAGDTLTTTFPAGSISLETFTSADGLRTIQKRTYVEDGKIKEVILDGADSIS